MVHPPPVVGVAAAAAAADQSPHPEVAVGSPLAEGVGNHHLVAGAAEAWHSDRNIDYIDLAIGAPAPLPC